MHTKVIRGVGGEIRVHHNSDWSGDAHVTWAPHHDVVVHVPAWVARKLVPRQRKAKAVTR